jgi:restriction endonuclease
MLERSILQIAKELIELKYRVQIIDIQLEDGTGKKFIVTTTSNPLKKQFVRL